MLYELRVQQQPVPNPPADASSVRWVLLEIVNQTPAEPPPNGASLTATTPQPDTPPHTGTSVQKTVFIGPQLVECTGVAPQQCMLMREQPDDPWMLMYDPIEGFTFAPGYTYELRVEQQPVPYPPADGSSLRWLLLEIVNQTPEEPLPSRASLSITSHQAGDPLDVGVPVVVTGTGQGLFEGNVVVYVLDNQGTV
ncbi:MAG: DUF4377 domain-containing protein, partial [Chloroflexaceae bacterium]|nr:DUF4377 domain-containing protein [Chloroflexaceae bacterium]